VLIAVGLYFVVDQLGVTSRSPDAARNMRAAFSACPRHVHAIDQVPLKPSQAGTMVPLDPIAGQLCVYSFDRGAPTTLQWTAALLRGRAGTLALLLDRRGRPGGRGGSCDGGHPALIRLRYPNSVLRSILTAGCDPELVSTPAGLKALSPTGALPVAALIDPPLTRGDRVTPVPDYVGQPLASVARAFRQHFHATGEGLSPYELIDPAVPFGQIVWETPLPGTAQAMGSTGASLIVAVHSEPPCRADQLRGRYANGEAGVGDQFGGIEVIDISSGPCSVKGRLTLHGVDSDGRPDTDTVTEQIGQTLVVSPSTTLRTLERDPAAALIMGFGFSGNASRCYDHETVPKVWSLTVNTDVTIRIPNVAPGERGRFYSCYGNLSFGLSPGVQLLGS
jgi:hypothetical protein